MKEKHLYLKRPAFTRSKLHIFESLFYYKKIGRVLRVGKGEEVKFTRRGEQLLVR